MTVLLSRMEKVFYLSFLLCLMCKIIFLKFIIPFKTTLQFEVQFVSLHKSDLAGNSSHSANAIIAKARIDNRGTNVHEQVKSVDRSRKVRQFENVKGTEAHEKLKEADRIRKNLSLENIRGSDAHEQLKEADRIRKNVIV